MSLNEIIFDMFFFVASSFLLLLVIVIVASWNKNRKKTDDVNLRSSNKEEKRKHLENSSPNTSNYVYLGKDLNQLELPLNDSIEDSQINSHNEVLKENLQAKKRYSIVNKPNDDNHRRAANFN